MKAAGSGEQGAGSWRVAGGRQGALAGQRGNYYLQCRHKVGGDYSEPFSFYFTFLLYIFKHGRGADKHR